MWFWFAVIALLCWSGSDLFSKIGCQDADEERQHLCGLLVCEVALPPGYQFFQHGLAYDESNVVRPRGRWGLVDVIS